MAGNVEITDRLAALSAKILGKFAVKKKNHPRPLGWVMMCFVQQPLLYAWQCLNDEGLKRYHRILLPGYLVAVPRGK